MNTQYAVCHLQKGRGNDSGMACHIERRDAKGNRYIPDNADGSRTELNREMIKFPADVTNRTEAIQHRLKTAGLKRKIGKNQVAVVRVLLTGTHEQMMELAHQGKLAQWVCANLKWLNDTFGEENVVSCVLHMDEKTPHLHASIIPIVNGKRNRRTREGKQKYQTQEGPRLSVSDVMARWRLKEYQDSYGKAMKPFGLERGIIGSTAHHKSRQQYSAEQLKAAEAELESIQTDIERLLAEKEEERLSIEKGKAGLKAKIFRPFGRGELAEAEKSLKAKDEEIAKLKAELDATKKKITEMQRAMGAERDGYKREIEAAVKRAERAEAACAAKDRRITQLDRQLNPERYRLSSGAELSHWWIPNRFNPTLSIWTKFNGEESHTGGYSIPPQLLKALDSGAMTIYELINEITRPFDQVAESQHPLLATMLQTAAGGDPTLHTGNGGGCSDSDLRWDGRNPNDFKRKGHK